MTPDERGQLEASYTFKRIVELELDPVRGNFDAAHLKEINRRIFQDLPGAGFDDVTPGAFRQPVPESREWMKHRGLSTVQGSFYVAYSRMDNVAQSRLNKALASAKPDAWSGLNTAEFITRLVKLYTELDCVHPFSDGNSRTLRTFTRQLAQQSGFELDWQRFGHSDVSRDMLYIARDLSVNALATPNIQHEPSLRKILLSMDRLQGNLDLPALLRDAVRPSRAVAFARLPEPEALQAYPDLKEAYATLHAASNYFEGKLAGNPELQQRALQTVVDQVQMRLNEGEIKKFGTKTETVSKSRAIKK